MHVKYQSSQGSFIVAYLISCPTKTTAFQVPIIVVKHPIIFPDIINNLPSVVTIMSMYSNKKK